MKIERERADEFRERAFAAGCTPDASQAILADGGAFELKSGAAAILLKGLVRVKMYAELNWIALLF